MLTYWQIFALNYLPAAITRRWQVKECAACVNQAKFNAAKGIVLCAVCRDLLYNGCHVGVCGELEDATHAAKVDMGYVCCAGCAEPGLYAGRWTPEGIISPYQYGTMAAEALMTGKPMFVNIIY